MKNVLLLNNSIVNNGVLDFSKRNLVNLNVEQKSLYRENVPYVFVRIFRRISVLFSYFVLGKWKHEVTNKYDALIVLESDATVSVLRSISHLKCANKKILYFMNAITESNNQLLQEGKKLGYSIYTYNLEDSQKYQINYTNQFWNKDLVPKRKTDIEQDLFFVGNIKNRYQAIIEVMKLAERKGLVTKFVIISENGEPYTQREELTYYQCIEEISKSKAVVDIVGEGNVGLTWRPLEALFMEKKLITNYQNIVNYDFYPMNKDNIFVLGVDDNETIAEFINRPYQRGNIDVNDYDIETWIHNIIGGR